MSHEAVANGNVVQSSHTQGTQGPRRFAAAIGRDHPAVERIRASVLNDAVVWLTDSGGNDAVELEMPDGWSVESTLVTSDGGVALRVSRD